MLNLDFCRYQHIDTLLVFTPVTCSLNSKRKVVLVEISFWFLVELIRFTVNLSGVFDELPPHPVTNIIVIIIKIKDIIFFICCVPTAIKFVLFMYYTVIIFTLIVLHFCCIIAIILWIEMSLYFQSEQFRYKPRYYLCNV